MKKMQSRIGLLTSIAPAASSSEVVSTTIAVPIVPEAGPPESNVLMSQAGSVPIIQNGGTVKIIQRKTIIHGTGKNPPVAGQSYRLIPLANANSSNTPGTLEVQGQTGGQSLQPTEAFPDMSIIPLPKESQLQLVSDPTKQSEQKSTDADPEVSQRSKLGRPKKSCKKILPKEKGDTSVKTVQEKNIFSTEKKASTSSSVLKQLLGPKFQTMQTPVTDMNSADPSGNALDKNQVSNASDRSSPTAMQAKKPDQTSGKASDKDHFAVIMSSNQDSNDEAPIFAGTTVKPKFGIEFSTSNLQAYVQAVANVVENPKLLEGKSKMEKERVKKKKPKRPIEVEVVPEAPAPAPSTSKGSRRKQTLFLRNDLPESELKPCYPKRTAEKAPVVHLDFDRGTPEPEPKSKLKLKPNTKPRSGPKSKLKIKPKPKSKKRTLKAGGSVVNMRKGAEHMSVDVVGEDDILNDSDRESCPERSSANPSEAREVRVFIPPSLTGGSVHQSPEPADDTPKDVNQDTHPVPVVEIKEEKDQYLDACEPPKACEPLKACKPPNACEPTNACEPMKTCKPTKACKPLEPCEITPDTSTNLKTTSQSVELSMFKKGGFSKAKINFRSKTIDKLKAMSKMSSPLSNPVPSDNVPFSPTTASINKKLKEKLLKDQLLKEKLLKESSECQNNTPINSATTLKNFALAVQSDTGNKIILKLKPSAIGGTVHERVLKNTSIVEQAITQPLPVLSPQHAVSGAKTTSLPHVVKKTTSSLDLKGSNQKLLGPVSISQTLPEVSNAPLKSNNTQKQVFIVPNNVYTALLSAQNSSGNKLDISKSQLFSGNVTANPSANTTVVQSPQALHFAKILHPLATPTIQSSVLQSQPTIISSSQMLQSQKSPSIQVVQTQPSLVGHPGVLQPPAMQPVPHPEACPAPQAAPMLLPGVSSIPMASPSPGTISILPASAVSLVPAPDQPNSENRLTEVQGLGQAILHSPQVTQSSVQRVYAVPSSTPSKHLTQPQCMNDPQSSKAKDFPMLHSLIHREIGESLVNAAEVDSKIELKIDSVVSLNKMSCKLLDKVPSYLDMCLNSNLEHTLKLCFVVLDSKLPPVFRGKGKKRTRLRIPIGCCVECRSQALNRMCHRNKWRCVKLGTNTFTPCEDDEPKAKHSKM